MVYTKAEKEELISRFEIHLEERKKLLINDYNTLSQILESKIARRINRVPKRLWDVKMRDVLEVERDHKLGIASLIADIESLSNGKENNMVPDTSKISDEDIERMKLQLRRAINFRKINKTKNTNGIIGDGGV